MMTTDVALDIPLRDDITDYSADELARLLQDYEELGWGELHNWPERISDEQMMALLRDYPDVVRQLDEDTVSELVSRQLEPPYYVDLDEMTVTGADGGTVHFGAVADTETHDGDWQPLLSSVTRAAESGVVYHVDGADTEDDGRISVVGRSVMGYCRTRRAEVEYAQMSDAEYYAKSPHYAIDTRAQYRAIRRAVQREIEYRSPKCGVIEHRIEELIEECFG